MTTPKPKKKMLKLAFATLVEASETYFVIARTIHETAEAIHRKALLRSESNAKIVNAKAIKKM